MLHTSASEAEQALAAAFRAIEVVEEAMSLYRPNSALCRLNREGVLANPPALLVRALEHSQAMSARTEGAFDITMQPLWLCYDSARQQGRLPTEAELAAARALVDWRQVRADSREVRLSQVGAAITLNGIAQGLAVDEAMSALRTHGVEHALIDAGELGSLGQNQQRPWSAGLQHPRREDAYIGLTQLSGRCLATSGDYASAFREDLRVHHLINPHSGQPANHFASVSILASTAMEADALSTAVFILGEEKGLALLADTPGADALLVDKEGRARATAGFPLASV